ncbi:MAG TPA: periplasmic heavy metal sensor [Gemmatimonadales bacterium]|jgi:Spy/CpxP family protein refolding chaperone|nr:periplasmic heavy metal sensor [Gemmatimonadales bacterium]
MRTTLLAAYLFTTIAVAPAAAQGGGHQEPHASQGRDHPPHAEQGPGHAEPDDPIAHLLFPPELVIQHAQDIGLQPAQRATIVSALKEMQGDMIELKLQMAERGGDLAKLIGEPKVDEAAALAQVDRVLTLEREVKRRQMQLLIRIKNALTPEQQERLARLRDREPGRPE